MTALAPALDQMETTRRFGGHSMTATLRSVMIRRPASPLAASQWQDFGYLHAVGEARTATQHAAVHDLFACEGIEVIAAGPDEAGMLDAIFAYDPSLMTDRGAVVLRIGKELRGGEPAAHAATYEALGIPIFGRIEAPGTVEGGDTLWLDERTLAVGRGYRTNASGIRQLRTIMEELNVETLAYDLPRWTGPGDCLHLMSLISPVAGDLAVVYPRLMAVAFLQEIEERGWRLVEVPDEEFDSMGCNVLALAPGRCLMVDGNSETRRRLEAAGCEVVIYAGDEVSLNRAGGPTCLTRPIWREDRPPA